MTWENLTADLEFQTWKSKYFSLSKKQKIELLKSINKKPESKEIKQSKSGNLKNSDEIIAVITVAKKEPTFKKITYVIEEADFSCVFVLSLHIFGAIASFDSRTIASMGDTMKPSKIKGFFKGLANGFTKLAGCVQIIAKAQDSDDDDE